MVTGECVKCRSNRYRKEKIGGFERATSQIPVIARVLQNHYLESGQKKTTRGVSPRPWSTVSPVLFHANGLFLAALGPFDHWFFSGLEHTFKDSSELFSDVVPLILLMDSTFVAVISDLIEQLSVVVEIGHDFSEVFS